MAIPPINPPPGASVGSTPAAQGLVAKFNALPVAGKLAGVLGVIAGAYLMLGGGGSSSNQQQNINMGVDTGAQSISPTTAFQGLESDRPALMQNVYEQNRRDLAEFRGKIEEYFQQQSTELQSSKEQNAELQRQMQQMMADFTSEIKNLQSERAKDAERLAQLATQQQQMELNAPFSGASGASPVPAPRRNIVQKSLMGGSSGTGGKGQPLLAPVGNAFTAATSSVGNSFSALGNVQQKPQARLPFVPPLGFVKATLLNGVDAFVGGEGVPTLARISGQYKTAMNSTVSLDGCIVMLQLSANISTERVIGKPARMTCVYPDSGAATYSLSGYMVDARDGIIGVPGVLKEGDPNRIAGAIAADFLAGAASVASQNQNTTTQTGTNLTVQSVTLSGDQTKKEIAKGVEKSMSQLRDYIKERADRVQPYIRLEALREVNLVLLDGTELRAEGGPWTLLFDAKAGDSSRARGFTGDLNFGQQPSSSGAAPTTKTSTQGQ